MKTTLSRVRKNAKGKTIRFDVPSPEVGVDYPREGENITGSHYAFRISVGLPVTEVEISLNRGDWKPCRPALGFWWYDWTGFGAGDYELQVRACDAQGASKIPVARRFRVL
ncbi:MAG: hypothetical protein HY551_04190 [Elusimicrobia bacterium]|nr:hypothetical protein [Elusimicrobiota bacterium]